MNPTTRFITTPRHGGGPETSGISSPENYSKTDTVTQAGALISIKGGETPLDSAEEVADCRTENTLTSDETSLIMSTIENMTLHDPAVKKLVKASVDEKRVESAEKPAGRASVDERLVESTEKPAGEASIDEKRVDSAEKPAGKLDAPSKNCGSPRGQEIEPATTGEEIELDTTARDGISNSEDDSSSLVAPSMTPDKGSPQTETEPDSLEPEDESDELTILEEPYDYEDYCEVLDLNPDGLATIIESDEELDNLSTFGLASSREYSEEDAELSILGRDCPIEDEEPFNDFASVDMGSNSDSSETNAVPSGSAISCPGITEDDADGMNAAFKPSATSVFAGHMPGPRCSCDPEAAEFDNGESQQQPKGSSNGKFSRRPSLDLDLLAILSGEDVASESDSPI